MAPNSKQEAYEYLYKGNDVIESLTAQQQSLGKYMEGLTERQAEMAYAPGKWSAKELIGHLIDTERIMSYRALAISRGEKQLLPGFDENDYVRMAQFNQYPVSRLLVQYHAQRHATIQLIASFTEKMLARTGTANNKTTSVKEITEKIAAHEQHHIRVLEQRYLSMWH